MAWFTYGKQKFQASNLSPKGLLQIPTSLKQKQFAFWEVFKNKSYPSLEIILIPFLINAESVL